MKKIALFVLLFLGLCPALSSASPMRVVLLDFIDETGGSADASLTGPVSSKKFAEKGPFYLAKSLLKSGDFTLIDRRDFIAQIQKIQNRDGSDPIPDTLFATRERHTPLGPTFFNAAQSLDADAMVRGSLMSMSTGKQKINQGGYKVEFTTLTMRVMLQALDTVRGDVIAMGEGSASRKFRQTAAVQTELGEDEVMQLYQEAIANAIPEIEEGLASRLMRDKPGKIKVWIATDKDPALVEMDGLLIGSTPVEGVEVNKGDHTLTITKTGYESITKKVMLTSDMKITVPMISNQLNAKERKEAIENMRFHFLKIN